MPVHNTDIAACFNTLADLLEIEGANAFRIRAYRNAARTVAGLPQRVADMVAEGTDLASLPGIGKDLAAKITEIVETGTLQLLQDVEHRVRPELATLLHLPGLGPKRVQTLHDTLGITSLDELETAARAGKIRQLSGFGEQTEQNILEALSQHKGHAARLKRVLAEAPAVALEAYLKGVKGVKDLVVAGSYRRRLETVGDLDILVTCKRGSRVMEHFVEYEDVERVVSHGKTRATVVLRSGLQVDLRVVAQVSYGAALHYFTGSKAHNIAIRKLGQNKGLKINEYGVFRGKKRVAGRREHEVYAQVDLPYIEPELREDHGEIEAARNHQLPTLITLDDIVGDLHAHTRATDGRNSLEEMAQAAQARGYQYLAITDHSPHVRVTNGLTAKRLRQQIDAIDRLNATLDGLVLLKAIEVDILEDGSLDLSDDILQDLDFTVCSVHSHFHLSRSKQTERIIRAMDNPYFTILGHPTGRLIQKRAPYQVDMERLLAAARERGCFLELNAQPKRLDPPAMYCTMAKDMGLKMAISTDAHSVNNLDVMRFGIDQARRGWLSADDVLNTRNWQVLHKLFKRA
jgi:DNA polymerase (family 10)